MNNEEMKAYLQSIIARTPFAASLGAEVLSISPGNVELCIPVVPEKVHQHHGFVHGAVIGFVADSACAWAAGSVAGDVVTSEYKLNLLAPATGEKIIGVGSVIKASSRSVVSKAEIYSERANERKLVAFAVATIMKVETK
ncbi:thioesterase [Cupriavidus sp. SK-3]|uniref:PaaI family thioesterase n=1 Tax=Cupriavidus sp. SK-3 TaxID=1470558 RepID=UPI00044FCD42|nr:PaaI family thioesterase [Cupriavidus sp. SK-3]KDP88107.1 thioesterase [Cupriavidus sp. SK-3]